MSDDPKPPARPAAPAKRPDAPSARSDRPAAPASASAPASRPARPAAPVAVPRRESAVDAPIIPQGLSLAEPGLSGIPSLQADRPATAELNAAQRRARSIAIRQTLLPSCLVLGITLPLLAAGWFTLDRFSVVRDNAMGLMLPITLVVVGVLFLAATALLWLGSRPATTPERPI